jgi:murein L,D-transpeptidase YafK
MRYLLLFFVVFYVNAKAIETKELSEHLPEDLLVMSLDKISQGDIKSAINDINTLIKQVPNFKLAHLIHGDLLTAHSGNLNFFGGQIHKSNPDLVKDFKEEASRRIKNYLQNNKKILPNYNIQLSQKYKYLIYVDVKRSRLFTYKNDNGQLVFNSDHYVSIGKNGFDKKYEGDRKTPVGMYFLKNKIKRELPDLYGDGAYRINYPNQYDKLKNYTGSGIWVHGTPGYTYSRAPLSSDGCIVLSNLDLNKISNILNTPNTPIIITNKSIGEINTLTDQKKTILNRVEDWKKQWMKKDFNNYIKFYEKNAMYNNHLYEKWVERKKNIIRKSKNINIQLSDISIFEYPNIKNEMVLVNFDQNYQSNLSASKMLKTQIWIKKIDGWKILYEGK